MTALSEMQRLVGHGTNRIKDDFYPTPDSAINALLERETFDGDIWEPACGDGAISKKLIDKGYNVFSTDLVYRDFGQGDYDFLKSMRECDNIVTNPPFNIGTKFTLHALRLARRKIVMFNKLTFLEGKERRDKLYCQKHLEKVYIFSERQSFGNHKGGMLAFAWFVFNKEFQGNAQIEFI